jgi:hypothetical protein
MVERFPIWEHFAVSHIADHRQDCCRTARAWFLASDRSLRSYGPPSLPSWIRLRYDWGPCLWPLYWCEAIRSKKLDCGALTDLTRHAIVAQGSVALHCQLIRKFNCEAISHWRALWLESGSPAEWAQGEHAYHEACAVVSENMISIWDPSDNRWIEACEEGYGSTVALRIAAPQDWGGSQLLQWGTRKIPIGTWVYLEGDH